MRKSGTARKLRALKAVVINVVHLRALQDYAVQLIVAIIPILLLSVVPFPDICQYKLIQKRIKSVSFAIIIRERFCD